MSFLNENAKNSRFIKYYKLRVSIYLHKFFVKLECGGRDTDVEKG
jgi:hypothetical protein